MKHERWQRVEQLVHSALKLEEKHRADFLNQACDGDEALAREVESLLAHESEAKAFIEAPALEMAAKAMAEEPDRVLIGQQIGVYKITSLLGVGGMGEVYRARDAKLGREVAIKVLPTSFVHDPERSHRFKREARLLAALNHPHIGAIYGFEEAGGIPALILELVEGQTLAERVGVGPIPVSDALPLARQIAEALEAAHEKGIIHRDLKPANIKVTPDGVVKVLDFGLAKAWAADGSGPDLSQLPTVTGIGTRVGMILGTAAYMSPEQARGRAVDKRTDIWAFGCVLYEMLTGQPPFGGDTVSDVIAAILEREPDWRALPTATPASIRRLLQRCLKKDPKRRLRDIGDARIELDEARLIVQRAPAKIPQNRFSAAEAIARQPREPRALGARKASSRELAPTRLIVLPFYQLRRDEETDFLCFSLPDAISSSLVPLQSLIVRSTRVGSRYVAASIDMKRVAQEAAVDAVVTGTLLRVGDHIRVSVELLKVPSGTLIWTHRAEGRLEDIFPLHDDLVARIVQSLAHPLTDLEQSIMNRDVPASARAYEFYLRANQLSRKMRELTMGRDLYLRCVSEDPNYAPAWVRLARCYRILAKYGADPLGNLRRSEEAFGRAFALNPDLPLAHSLYAEHEAEHGRATEAIVRLLNRIPRNRNDPELYAGLVYACRYVGLLDASVMAHELAHRIDPNIRTSVMNTHFAMGNLRLALNASAGDVGYVEAMALDALGRRQEALERLRCSEGQDLPPLLRRIMDMLRLFLENDHRRALECLSQINLEAVDPEGFFYRARLLARLGQTAEALVTLERAVRGGFWCVPTLLQDTYLEPVRATSAFHELLLEAETRSTQAAAAFAEAGGKDVLSTSGHSMLG